MTETEPAPPERLFLRRCAALAMDVAILVGIGTAISALLFEPLVRLGNGGRFIGLAMTLLYASAFEARGATPGKQLLGLRVLDPQSEVPGPARALLRNAVLFAPWFATNLANPSRGLPAFAASLPYAIYASSAFAAAFGPEHRAIHDWVAGTQAVRSGVWTQAKMTRTTAALMAAPVIFAAVVAVIPSPAPFSPLLRIVDAVRALPSRPRVFVNDRTLSNLRGEKHRVLQVTASYDGPEAGIGAFGHTIFERVRDSGVDFAPYERVDVVVSRQAILGISFLTRNHGEPYSVLNGRISEQPSRRDFAHLAEQGPATWTIAGKSYEIRDWYYEYKESDGRRGLYYVVEWNCPSCAVRELDEARAAPLMAPIFSRVCEKKAWQRHELPGGLRSTAIAVRIADRSAGPTYPQYGAVKTIAEDCH